MTNYLIMTKNESRSEKNARDIIVSHQRADISDKLVERNGYMELHGFYPVVLAWQNVDFFENMGFVYGKNAAGEIGLFLDMQVLDDCGGVPQHPPVKK